MADFSALAKSAAAEDGGGEPVAQITSNGTLSGDAQAEAEHTSGADKAVEEKGDGNTGGQTSSTVVAEEESTAHFEPVVQLDEIKVKTHEEDEECLFKMRAKLFVFGETLLNKGTGSKSWNERGIGDIKFLKHKGHEKIRVLMRQEKTMKVISNHVIDPRIVLVPNAGSDRSWVWTAFDYAEGDLAETTFAIRFANSEAAKEFLDQYEACKKEMESILERENEGDDTEEEEEGEKAVDEASAAIESLEVKDEKEKESNVSS